MIGSDERRKLIEKYRDAHLARAVIFKAAAGLLVIFGVSAIGVLSGPDEPVATASHAAGASHP